MMTKTMFRGATIVAALVAAVAVFAAACGGAAETTATSATASTVAPATTAPSGDATVTSTDAGSSDTATTESGSIVVSGLVDYPMTFTFVDMDYMNWVTATVDDPASGSTSVEGVKLSEIFTFYGMQTAAKTLVVTGSDGTTAELTLADISADALLAVTDDDTFNLEVPGMPAADWVKDVVSMEFK